MIKLPAHKNMIDPPGQIINKDYAELEVRTLGQYLDRKYPEDKPDPKKLTFDEWFVNHIGMPFEDWDNNLQENDMRACWKAAQENK